MQITLPSGTLAEVAYPANPSSMVTRGRGPERTTKHTSIRMRRHAGKQVGVWNVMS